MCVTFEVIRGKLTELTRVVLKEKLARGWSTSSVCTPTS